MTRPSRLAVLAALTGILLAPRTAALGVSEGSTFGHHVSQCAQDIGFDGMHNPGMHRGISGTPADHHCASTP